MAKTTKTTKKTKGGKFTRRYVEDQQLQTRELIEKAEAARKVKNKPVKFNVTKEELPLVDVIVERAFKLYKRHGIDIDKLELRMDIIATHSNGCPLRLLDLSTASEFDFIHDVGGIRAHLNRETGRLAPVFSPRHHK